MKSNVGAFFTSLMISLSIAPFVISYMKKIAVQPIRNDGPKSHILKKNSTPTMGGFIILIGLIISCLIWSKDDDIYIWPMLSITVLYSLVGFYDDYKKIKFRNSIGISPRQKMFVLFIISLFISYWMYSISPIESRGLFVVPFIKSSINIGILYILIGSVVFVGTANAVNITDGLDGLAAGSVLITTSYFIYIANTYFDAIDINTDFRSEILIFCYSLIGSCLGFLWYNSFPAKIFMGDMGSLALGGALASISIILKHEILLIIVGGVFVIETISVIIQVVYFKITRRRIFKMSPIHHHFEHIGWSEANIVTRFWILNTIFVGLALIDTLS